MGFDTEPSVTRRGALGLALALFVAAIGCQKDEEVTRYSVPRPPSSNTTRPQEAPAAVAQRPDPTGGGPARMLAAIVTRGETAWFFKLLGPDEVVAAQGGPFRKLVGSVAFTDASANPGWKLPEGWRQNPGTGMRFATVEISTPKGPLELTVTPLRITGGYEDYVVANVDRWRQQLGLQSTTREQLFGSGGRPGELTELKLGDGEKAVVVELTGRAATDTMGGLAGTSPFPPMGGNPSAPATPGIAGPGTGSPAGPSGGSRLKYQTPAGWSPGKAEGMRQAAFDVRDGSKSAELTVIALAAGSGDLLSNVNRWRDQVKLKPVDQKELDALVRDLVVDGEKGKKVDLIGPADAQPREGILGVICTHGNQVWFFKMKGDPSLLERERDRFDAFIRSVKFE